MLNSRPNFLANQNLEEACLLKKKQETYERQTNRTNDLCVLLQRQKMAAIITPKATMMDIKYLHQFDSCKL